MIRIDFLADHLDVIPILAQWFRAQWPDYFADWSQADMEQDFLIDARREGLPIRLVAFEGNQLVGTIILREPGNEALADFHPELGGLYVLETQRGRRFGSQLVQAGMNLARQQGFESVYATTTAAAGILKRLGWQYIKSVVQSDGEFSLYQCKLTG